MEKITVKHFQGKMNKEINNKKNPNKEKLIQNPNKNKIYQNNLLIPLLHF